MSIEKIAVIGSGLMGHGIAQVVATSGQEVSLIDVSDDLLAKARQRIEASLGKFAEKGKIQESPQSILKRIGTTTSIAGGVSDADYVIEAVYEDINLKKEILSEVDKHAPEHAILATNTTGLSVTVIAEAARRKGKVIGMHWMNPPQIMRLIEIIKGRYTDEETLQSTLELCKRYGKETVIAQRDVWQFLAARARVGWSIETNLIYWRKDFNHIRLRRYFFGVPRSLTTVRISPVLLTLR